MLLLNYLHKFNKTLRFVDYNPLTQNKHYEIVMGKYINTVKSLYNTAFEGLTLFSVCPSTSIATWSVGEQKTAIPSASFIGVVILTLPLSIPTLCISLVLGLLLALSVIPVFAVTGIIDAFSGEDEEHVNARFI